MMVYEVIGRIKVLGSQLVPASGFPLCRLGASDPRGLQLFQSEMEVSQVCRRRKLVPVHFGEPSPQLYLEPLFVKQGVLELVVHRLNVSDSSA
jgi:hypothetical protein